MPDAIIIGAGISGLTAAHKLSRAGKDVVVLEEASRAGGKIVTEREEGYLLESGPNSLRIENQETIDLIRDAGLEERILEASPLSKTRFVLKNGRWVQLPRGPLDATITPLLSPMGKLRILGDLFVPKTKLEDEPTASFVRRRLGKEILDYGADPFITGIYAGDPEKLSMRYAFGSMWRAEQQDGSLIRGLAKGRPKSGAARVRPRVVSFPEGLSELTNALKIALGQKLKLHSGAVSIEKAPNGYRVTSSAGALESPVLILTLPAYHVAPMIAPLSGELSNSLLNISYPPVAVVFFGYRIDQFKTVPEGFGGLIPSKENRKILGIIFSSSNFPKRAPEEHALFTILMGGAKHPEIIDWDERRIFETALGEASNLLKPSGEPVFQHLKVWRHAIPQYNVGYGDILSSIKHAEAVNPGLHFIGNYRGGISMGSCIRNATELARKLV